MASIETAKTALSFCPSVPLVPLLFPLSLCPVDFNLIPSSHIFPTIGAMGYFLPERPRRAKAKNHKIFNVKFSSLIGDYSPKSQPIADVLTFHYLGFKRKYCRVVAVAKGVLRFTNDIQDFLATCKDRRVVFRPGGAFALVVECPLGESFINDLKAKLRLIIRLTTILRALKRQKLTPTEISLNSVTFTYHTPSDSSAEDAPLTCKITIPDQHTETISISLTPDSSNPHIRVKSYLEHLLARSTDLFLQALPTTLPCLRALSRLESAGVGSIRNRSIDSFRIAYLPVPTVFDLSLKRRRNIHQWFLSELPPPGSSNQSNPQVQQAMLARRPQGYAEAMATLFVSSGAGYRGLKNMIACDMDGVETAVDLLDSKIREIIAAGGSGSTAPLQLPQPTGNNNSSNNNNNLMQRAAKSGVPVPQHRAVPGAGNLLRPPPGVSVITLD